MPKSKPRRPGPFSEVQILLGLTKEQDALIKRAAKICTSDDEKRELTRAEFIRESAHYQAELILKKAGKL